jgi:hypothetical protein
MARRVLTLLAKVEEGRGECWEMVPSAPRISPAFRSPVPGVRELDAGRIGFSIKISYFPMKKNGKMTDGNVSEGAMRRMDQPGNVFATTSQRPILNT